jgi:hypothetical protein
MLQALALTGFCAVLGALPATVAQEAKTVRLFDGTTLKGWNLKGKSEKSKWIVGSATLDEKNPSKFVATAIAPEASGGGRARLMINSASGGVNIYSEQKFGDCILEIELTVPKGSNSGIYVMGEYEVQILDSFGKTKVGPGDMGGIYGASAPKVNACKAPGEMQKFVIDFQAPRFENGKKVKNARFVRVTLNDQVIHENVEMKGPTPSGVTGKEHPTGPVMFQGDHGPVAFRTVKATPK